jgi:hypothetical protein
MISTKTLFVAATAPSTIALTGLGDNLSDSVHRTLRWASIGGFVFLGLRIFGVVK